MEIRRYRPEDWNEVIKLLYDTVHSINSADYTEIQLDAWVPGDMNLPELQNRLLSTYSVVAEMDSIVVGFGNAASIGYLDCLYTHRDYQRIGVASLIADDIENYFYRNGIRSITTDASITAKPFFKNRGYTVISKQNVDCRGQSLINSKMQKILL